MEIKLKLISELKPYAKNAKEHPKKQIQQIANSIKEFGFRQPLVISKDLELIVGHGRLEAAKLLNLKEVPCVIVDNLSKAQIKAYRLADNKLNESDWDEELVKEELQQLSIDLQLLTGFEELNETIKGLDLEDSLGQTFEIVIECEDEVEQEKIFNVVNKLGYKCRLLNI